MLVGTPFHFPAKTLAGMCTGLLCGMHIFLGSRSERGGARRASKKRVVVISVFLLRKLTFSLKNFRFKECARIDYLKNLLDYIISFIPTIFPTRT